MKLLKKLIVILFVSGMVSCSLSAMQPDNRGDEKSEQCSFM